FCSRPGRPPKRTQSMTTPESPHVLPHSVSGLMSSGMMSHTGKKMRKCSCLSVTARTNKSHSFSNEKSLELPFMMMPHPLIPVSLPPASVAMAMNQMNHLSTFANMAAVAQVQSVPSRMVTSVIKERVPDSPSPVPSLDDGRRSGSHLSSRQSSSVSSSPAHTESSSDRPHLHQNGLSLGHALLGLSPSAPPGPKEGDLATHDTGHETKRASTEKEENVLCTPTSRDSYERVSHSGPTLPPGFPAPLLFPEGLSSIETLLTNIQGLLKVAIDNARAQEKQVQLERTELKMELYRERELRETLERQLCVEQKNRALIQKRLKKEKKTKRKLQEALEVESKRRDQAEQNLQRTACSERSPTQNVHKTSNKVRTSIIKRASDGSGG
uniref:Dachshund c n=1 Tax=Cyprinus carpio TaxID=7962 RepID=A0A8C2IAQ9_CYPCA